METELKGSSGDERSYVKIEKTRAGWWHADEGFVGRVYRVLGEEVYSGLPCYRIPYPEQFWTEASVPVADCSIVEFLQKPPKTT